MSTRATVILKISRGRFLVGPIGFKPGQEQEAAEQVFRERNAGRVVVESSSIDFPEEGGLTWEERDRFFAAIELLRKKQPKRRPTMTNYRINTQLPTPDETPKPGEIFYHPDNPNSLYVLARVSNRKGVCRIYGAVSLSGPPPGGAPLTHDGWHPSPEAATDGLEPLPVGAHVVIHRD